MCNFFMQATFYQKYYDTAEKALKLILFDKGSSPKLFLRAKCLECMGILVRKVGQDVLKNWEVIKVIFSANSYFNFKLVNCLSLIDVNMPST